MNFIPSATVERRSGLGGLLPSYLVSTDWREDSGAPIDRPRTYGISVPTPQLAARVKAAVDSGRAFRGAHLRRDVNGKSYVEASFEIMGRTLEADLRRLGF